MNIKLTKASIRLAMSLIPMDMVFYKDENNLLYRLRYVIPMRPCDTIEALHRATCLSKYAPEIIDGEIIGGWDDEVRIEVENDVYVLQKNAEKLEFWDITDKASG